MPKTPKATDGDAPKKRSRKAEISGEDSTKVTKTVKAAKSAIPVETPAPVVEIPVQPANGRSAAKQVPMEERIRIRAYELYLRRGGIGGSPEQDWFQAMSEIYSDSVA